MTPTEPESPTVLAEPSPNGTPKRMGRPMSTGRPPLSEAEEQALIDLYTTSAESIADIAARFNVTATHPYRILAKHQITWRRGDAIGYETWLDQRTQPEIPEAQHRALEKMLQPRPEPVVKRAAPPVPRPTVTVDQSTQIWEVSVQGILQVAGNEIEDVTASVRALYPHLRITGIRQS